VSIAKCAHPGELARRKEQFSRGGWKSDRKLGESDDRCGAGVCEWDLAGARKLARKKKKSVAKRLRLENMLNSPPGFHNHHRRRAGKLLQVATNRKKPSKRR
jgi:hypothetical protein